MANVIAERTVEGCPVQMVVNTNNTISVLGKKRNGRRRDDSHDVDEFYEVNPGMAEELRGLSSPYDATLPWLASFVAQMWAEAADLDPWYFQEDEVLELEMAEA